MKTIKSPQSIPTPEPVPPKPETAGPNVATIPLVYASQMALTAALRSANAGDACTRENEMVNKIPQIISETAFFICPLPMLRCGGFTLIPLGYLPQVFPPNTCGIFPRSCSGLYLMPYSDFAGGRGWPTPWSPGYTFVQRSHRSPHPAAGHVRPAVRKIAALEPDHSPPNRHRMPVPRVGLAAHVCRDDSSLAGLAGRRHHPRIDDRDDRPFRPLAQQRSQKHRSIAGCASAHVIRGIDQDDRPIGHLQGLCDGFRRGHLHDAESVATVPQDLRQLMGDVPSNILLPI